MVAVDVAARLALRSPRKVEQIVSNPWLMRTERFGLIVRGLAWGFVGIVALAAIFGLVEKPLDFYGLLRILLSSPLLTPVAGVLSLGFFAYSLWGYVRAVLDPLERGRGLSGIAARIGFLWSALNYTAVAVFAAEIVLLNSASGSVLPFGLERIIYGLGQPLVLVGAGIVLITGIGQLIDAWRAPFRHDVTFPLSHRLMPTIWLWLGRYGLFARGIAFSVIAIAILSAGLRHDPHWALGLADCFVYLFHLPGGAVLAAIIALGFVALGTHSVIAAPWAHMGRPTSNQKIAFPAWTWSVRPVLLVIAAMSALAFVALTITVIHYPYLPIDFSVERAIQSVNWGPTVLTFPVFRSAGGPTAMFVTGGAILAVLVLNRRAWLLSVAAAAGGLWYQVLVHLTIRPRPTASQVLWVTEHPGGISSFPSGHVISFVCVSTMLMLCLGHRFLPRWALPFGWAAVALVVFLGCVSRIYVGAHWPSDVLASLLVATTWLSFVGSSCWITNPALKGRKDRG